MKTIKLTVITQIHSCHSAMSSNDVYVQKVFTLPFTPTAGIIISDKYDEVKLNDLYWKSDKKEWICYAEEDKFFYNRALNSSRNGGSILESEATEEEMNARVKEYLDMGWKVRRR